MKSSVQKATTSLPVHRRRLIGCLTAGWWTGKASAMESLLEQAKRVEYGLRDGSIRSCPSNLNPNCISTSSIGFDSYASPWRARGGSLTDVTEAIVETMPRACEGTQLVASQTSADGSYLRFEVKGLFGKDIVEFVAKEDDTVSRNWEGDSRAPLIFYRSIAREVKYIYPFTQPISDFGMQKKRMESIRLLLGWQKVGCELLECYQ